MSLDDCSVYARLADPITDEEPTAADTPAIPRCADLPTNCSPFAWQRAGPSGSGTQERKGGELECHYLEGIRTSYVVE